MWVHYAHMKPTSTICACHKLSRGDACPWAKVLFADRADGLLIIYSSDGIKYSSQSILANTVSVGMLTHALNHSLLFSGCCRHGTGLGMVGRLQAYRPYGV